MVTNMEEMMAIFEKLDPSWTVVRDSRPFQVNGMNVQAYYDEFWVWKEQLDGLHYPANEEAYVADFLCGLKWDLVGRVYAYKSKPSRLSDAFYRAKFEESMLSIESILGKLTMVSIEDNVLEELPKPSSMVEMETQGTAQAFDVDDNDNCKIVPKLYDTSCGSEESNGDEVFEGMPHPVSFDFIKNLGVIDGGCVDVLGDSDFEGYNFWLPAKPLLSLLADHVTAKPIGSIDENVGAADVRINNKENIGYVIYELNLMYFQQNKFGKKFNSYLFYTNETNDTKEEYASLMVGSNDELFPIDGKYAAFLPLCDKVVVLLFDPGGSLYTLINWSEGAHLSVNEDKLIDCHEVLKIDKDKHVDSHMLTLAENVFLKLYGYKCHCCLDVVHTVGVINIVHMEVMLGSSAYAWGSYMANTGEEFKHAFHVFVYVKDGRNSPIASEWLELQRFNIAGLNSYEKYSNIYRDCYAPFLKESNDDTIFSSYGENSEDDKAINGDENFELPSYLCFLRMPFAELRLLNDYSCFHSDLVVFGTCFSLGDFLLSLSVIWLMKKVPALTVHVVVVKLKLAGELVDGTLFIKKMKILHTFGFVASVLFRTQLTDLPFSLYPTFVIDERHGLNKQTMRLIFRDMMKVTALTIVISPSIMSIIVIVHKGSPYLAIYLLWSVLPLGADRNGFLHLKFKNRGMISTQHDVIAFVIRKQLPFVKWTSNNAPGQPSTYLGLELQYHQMEFLALNVRTIKGISLDDLTIGKNFFRESYVIAPVHGTIVLLCSFLLTADCDSEISQRIIYILVTYGSDFLTFNLGDMAISIVHGKSFIGFSQPNGTDEEMFGSLHSAISFDNIWDELGHVASIYTTNNGPQIEIINWNYRFIILWDAADTYYIIDTHTGLAVSVLPNNQFSLTPYSIAGLEDLEGLNVQHDLPYLIGLLFKLQPFYTSHNELSCLLDSSCHCCSLVEINTSVTKLTYLSASRLENFVWDPGLEWAFTFTSLGTRMLLKEGEMLGPQVLYYCGFTLLPFIYEKAYFYVAIYPKTRAKSWGRKLTVLKLCFEAWSLFVCSVPLLYWNALAQIVSLRLGL